MNPFAVGSIVKTLDGSKTGGEIKFIACHSATSGGGKTCPRAACNHLAKDYCFVSWPGGGMASYHHNELAFVNPPAASNGDRTSGSIIKTDNVESRDRDGGTLHQDAIDFRLYNGFLQIREGRDGNKYLVEVSNQPSSGDTPVIEENEIDYEAYATRIINIRKIR